MTGLLELAEACEKATGPDTDLDRAIGRAVSIQPAPRYTASLDAAMTLIPESEHWPDKHPSWDLSTEYGKWVADFTVFECSKNNGVDSSLYVRANTAPLALCAAALRSRAALVATNPNTGEGLS